MPEQETRSLDPSSIHVVGSNDGRTFLVDAFSAPQAERTVDEQLPEDVEIYYTGTLDTHLQEYLDAEIALLAPDPEVGAA